MTYRPTVQITPADSPSLDAFGRMRMSTPETIFASKQIYDEQPLSWSTSTTSGGTVAHRPNEASSRLTASSTIGSQAIRQTKRRFNYEAGKSQLIYLTFNMNSNVVGHTKRVGVFDENDGIFLELNGSDVRLVQRTSVSGSPSDARFAAQASWNIDPLDGSGPSGVTIDFSKVQIMIIDYQWLGVGAARIGFVYGRSVLYVHEFDAANVLTTVWAKTPNFPVRASVTNVASGASTYLDFICASIISEGGSDSQGIIRSINLGILSPIDAGTAGTFYAALGIRLKSTHLGAAIEILNIDVLTTTNNNFLWSLQRSPTINGTFTYNSLANSAIEYALGDVVTDPSTNTLNTAGTVIASGYGSANGRVITAHTSPALGLGATISGTRDTLVLLVTSGTTNDDFLAALTWRERY